MFFKFTTDLNYFLLHMSDSIPTDYVFLGTEFVLAMLAWNYFGLFRALKNTKTF